MQEITNNKFKEINSKLKNDKEQHGNEIAEKLRDMEDRLQRDNLKKNHLT